MAQQARNRRSAPQNQAPAPARSDQQVAKVGMPRLPMPDGVTERFGIDKTQWKALVEAIFPNAQESGAVVLALAYCKARNLDPFKRPVHIVPIWDRVKKRMVDTIWPGIGEIRTTAMRTKGYAGKDRVEWGPMTVSTFLDADNQPLEIEHPEYAQVTVYRMVDGQRVAFEGPEVYWVETYAKASRQSDWPNDMWRKRVRGQLEKCAEAAALRAAFPEELGGELSAEEAEGMEWQQTAPRGGVVNHRPLKKQAAAAQLEQFTQAPVDVAFSTQTAAPEPVQRQEPEPTEPAAPKTERPEPEQTEIEMDPDGWGSPSSAVTDQPYDPETGEVLEDAEAEPNR